MHSDPTAHNSTPVYQYQYNYTPYPTNPGTPPPPPIEKRSKGKIILLILAILLAMSVDGVVSYVAGKFSASHTSTLPTITVTTTSLSSTYRANDILNDFTANGLPVRDLSAMTLNKYLDGWGTGEYAQSEGMVTTQPSSSYFFHDPTVCVGPCDTEEDMFLAVYTTTTDAQTSLTQVQQWTNYISGCNCNPYQMPNDDIQHGRCLLITYQPLTSGYALMEDKYCI